MNIVKLVTPLIALSLGACAVLDQSANGPALERNAKWGLLPIVNHTDVPQAGLRAETLTDVLLRAQGIHDLQRYPAAMNQDSLFEPTERKVAAEAMNWGSSQNSENKAR
ncbi:MAG: hypothetical protein AB1722_02420 [Pseudomonadota bacterium]